MSEPRFFCRTLHPGLVELDEAQARHARLSLRLRPGDAITLFDGRGRVAHAHLAGSGESVPRGVGASRRRPASRSVAAAVVEAVMSVPPPARTLTLITAACKGPRLEWMIEKCTELGVTRLVLAEFERSVVRPGAGAAEKLARTALEACKQCRRAWLPEIVMGEPLVRVVKPFRGREAVPAAPAPPHDPGAPGLLVCDPEGAVPLAGWLHAHGGSLRHLVAIVGPEGGLTGGERTMLVEAGAQPVRLGEHVLRVETAAVAVAASWAARGEA